MKPITLKLAGLQSYREMQEIDFTELCDTGLFGIFGPTGSGKSTLLDAITLAMYGKVGRASGGTQGIMNQAEDSLFVSFTFELASAQGVERYRVERRFKRQNELSISNTLSRIVEISEEGDRVIADKLADVTRAVEEKIGLKMDDFTRAVVLPQGKFAEFLSLKGADRRQMLQRLFHLEQYGDLLVQKLSRKVKETDQTLKELEAEQQGLGNASEEALKQAESALREAAELAKLRREELAAAQRQADELAKLRELSEERGLRAAKLAELRAQEVDIAKLEADLARAAAAESLRPTLAAWREAQQVTATREQSAASAKQAATEASAAASQAAEAAELARLELAAKEPALLLRLSELEQAKRLQAECDVLLAELKQLQVSREEAARKREQLGAEQAKEEQLLAKAQQRQRELEQQRAGYEVAPDERERIQAAYHSAQEIARLQQQQAAAAQEEAAYRVRTEQAALRLQDLVQAKQLIETGCHDLAREALEQIYYLQQLSVDAVSCRQLLTQLEAELKASLKERELHIWSLRLAEQLQEGAPCPVCGSEHHPGMVLTEGQFADEEAELTQIGELLGRIQELQYELSRDLDTGNSLLELLGVDSSGAKNLAAEELELIETTGTARQETAASVMPSVRDGESEQSDPLTSLSVLQQSIVEIGEKQGQLRTLLQQLQRDARKAKADLTALLPQHSATQSESAAAIGLLDQSSSRSEALLEELTTKLGAWQQAYPPLSLDSVGQLQEQIQAKDRQLADVRERLAVSIPYIEERTARIASLVQKGVELDKQLLQAETQEQGKKALLQEKQERLNTWIGSEQVGQLLLEAENSLKSLRQAAEHTRKLQLETSTHSNEAGTLAASANQAAVSAREQEQYWAERCSEQLAASPFATEQEAVEALMSAEQSEASAQRIKVHRDEQLEHKIRLKELDVRLNGRMVDQADWEACQLALSLAKQQDEAALQGQARSERDLEDLASRHVRWKELEVRRLDLEHQAGLMAKLQTTLRGNAFVEYVAEEQLMNVSHAASQRLRSLTKQRYSLETDSGGGFVICDDANGGVKRPVGTLSGGETFLTSLALALALSAQIQLRGKYPLQFFFLDEGFGTLDPELLDTVITSLEHLHHDHLSVGIITHVAELRARLVRKLVVIPAESGGEGSKVVVERM
ncbi:AAA family ATPase [Paenibacillus lutimineralis]|uniref:Nuclease SbcCD subunit C n=1 Tax=Paenibacillus lutimineralis TaxID=2707005 RepID=A0A3Q9I7Q0_9BACL|nr:SMC family ATPase [Paenibacillus lutimineralis]AZS14450.1 SMC family ATPase [Paenibacillus lutimineralis]